MGGIFAGVGWAGRVVIAVGLALWMATAVRAERTASNPGDDQWHLDTRGGFWALSVNGTTGTGRDDSDVDACFTNIAEHAQFAINPSLDLSKGDFVIAFNGTYAHLEDSESFRDRRGFSITAQDAVFDLAVGYTVLKSDLCGMPLAVTPAIGGRYTLLKLELDPDGFHSFEDTRGWFDPYVGGRITLGVTRNLDWRSEATIGGFGVGSNLTWSAGMFADWRITNRLQLNVGYRALGWDYDLNQLKWDITFHGPWIGLTYRWF